MPNKSPLTDNGYFPEGSYPSVVYFVRMGRRIKIGFSTNLDGRLKSFTGHSPEKPEVLLTMPGGRNEERRLHAAFAQYRTHGEFFEDSPFVTFFAHVAKESGLDAAWVWLNANDPAVARQRREQERLGRTAERRKTRTELNTYFAGLVTERKQRLGW